MGTVHPIDPARDQHYAVSEDSQFRLQCLNNALLACAVMMERNPGEISPELESDWLGGLFRVFAFQLEDVMNESPFARGSETVIPSR